MASVGEEEVEYESDPEEAKRSLAMRRRVASDDEGEEEERENQRVVDRRAVVESDESDGQGGVAEYDYDDELDDEEEEEEEVYEEELEEVDEVVVVAVKEMEGGNEDRGVAGDGEGEDEAVVAGELADGEAGDEVEEEKKENEPFAVPTAGAFYMHDDRFRDNARGRNRRTFGGRKLWESKDERKWGHDKFEEMSMQERHYEEGRGNSKGRYRGRGRIRGADRGYTRGNRSKSFNENSNNNYESNNPNQTPKAVRGRGPRRYEPSARNSNAAPSTKSKQYGKSLEKSSHNSSGRVLTSASNADSDSVPAKGHVFASSLNYASPPFYPSSSSNKDNLNQKRDVQAGNNNRNPRQPVVDDNSPVTQPHTSLREKNVVGSVGMDKLHIDDSVNPTAGKSFNSAQMLHSGSSSVNGVQFPQTRSQGRGMAFQGQMGYQPTSHGHGSRVSPSTHAVHRAPIQGRGQPVQPSLQSPAHMLGQRPGSGSQASSPPKTAQSFNSFESGETDSPSESSKPKNALVKGKTSSIQGNGRGSFLYSGAQVMGASGNMGVGHGDQNFPGTPAFLPVMQFGGQHPGGIGVPALGMAFPGYVARPQLGLGNSEMAWLPVLAGAAGALGASYGQPYIAVDGSYHARPSAQPTSSTGSSSKENNTNKPNNEWNSSQKQEIASDEFGQRQNKARRYSEMNFGQ